METADQRLDGNYTLKRALDLIFMSYKESGIAGVKVELFEESPVAQELGATPSGWNEGLFRYLDECIYLLNLSEYCFLTPQVIDKSNGYSSIIILIHQMKSNCAAVRLLSSHGLDSQARLSLRALYENSIAICRSLIDEDFRAGFSSVTSTSTANEFWHKYMSKAKSEKFLESYNENCAVPCPLVSGDNFKEIYRRLGVSAHPNYLFSHFEYIKSFNNEEKTDRLFSGSKAATEFVLSSTCQITLATITFILLVSPEKSSNTPWIMKYGIFEQFEYVRDIIKCIGKLSFIMLMMLMKWSNRQKVDFDPALHL